MHCRDAQEMRWRCAGDALEMRWRCAENAGEIEGVRVRGVRGEGCEANGVRGVR